MQALQELLILNVVKNLIFPGLNFKKCLKDVLIV